MHGRDAAIHGRDAPGYLRMPWFILVGGCVLIVYLLPPFLRCEPGVTPDGSGILSDPHLLVCVFRKAWLPFFCRGNRGSADLSASNTGVGGWLPTPPVVDRPPLTGTDLFDTVQKKKPTAGRLDG